MRIIMSSQLHRDSDIALIVRAVSRLGRRLRTEAPPGGLSAGMIGLLAALYREGPMPGVALAEAEGLKPQSLTRLLAAMEENGMIERAPDRGDRRNLVISITVKGRKALRGAMQERRRWLADRIGERLSSEERKALIDAAELMLRIAL
ncbi:MarR family transcriptional regulator [Sphingomonas sp. QA11]|uniref:MarR family winged helix-turn-helix transcriptional regulator n=1 Tax=Sphingomonas sp. QA11 TaxID=2950605 RepID=UPI00234A560E|nr:MarR family transcriptional regulator [Sphingomonas sp. QA11]WCM27559.1 MarR family transcriptional regulator [Sphingomonas sp. QA11]